MRAALSSAASTVARWVPRGREREAVLQAAKMTGAAVLAWVAARLVTSSPQSFVAPYAAVFLMTATVYRSLTNAVQQASALLVGLVVAYGVGVLVPQPVAALGIAVFVGMMLGQWHRFGANGIWVGVTALLSITYGTAGNVAYLVQWMGQMVFGCVIGVAVNMLIVPPVYLRRPRDAVSTLVGEVCDLLRTMAAELGEKWELDTAARWLRRARRLDSAVDRAYAAVAHGRESTRWNIRWLVHRRRGYRPPSEFEAPLRTLAEVSEQVKRIAEAMTTAAHDEKFDWRFAAYYAPLLDALAEAVSCLDSAEERFDDLPDRLATVAERHRRLTVRPGTSTPAVREAEDGTLLASARSLHVLRQVNTP
ncbi:aromatic acid exporter family protein [Nocardia sp. BMG51109]|uniref:FUSC family protein n=1 Tax=Nocardia sp. BMG51109 TaxID=1056816 RepID=UPI0004BCFED2|nr:FUSC family protein [Nocardia sp. BMG51109]